MNMSRSSSVDVAAAGHGMWGLVLAPVTGELIARGVIEGGPTLREPSPSPDRFGATRPLSFVKSDLSAGSQVALAPVPIGGGK